MTNHQRKALQQLVDANGQEITLVDALWTSRWALLQWILVFAVALIFLVQIRAARQSWILIAFGLGAFIAQVASMRRAIENWQILKEIVDIEKARTLLTS